MNKKKTHICYNLRNAGEPGKREQESGNNAAASIAKSAHLRSPLKLYLFVWEQE